MLPTQSAQFLLGIISSKHKTFIEERSSACGRNSLQRLWRISQLQELMWIEGCSSLYMVMPTVKKKRHLMTWLYRQTGRTIFHKRLDLDFFIRWRERFLEAPNPVSATSGNNNPIGLSSNVQSASTISDPTPGNPLLAATYFSSNHSLENSDILKVDLDAPSLTCITYPKKGYSIDIHIQLLQRDIEELDSLRQRMALAHTRIDVRLMEKFGRRVWRKQDIYIPWEGRRVHVDRKAFLSMVRFGNRPFKTIIRVDPSTMNADQKDSQEAP